MRVKDLIVARLFIGANRQENGISESASARSPNSRDPQRSTWLVWRHLCEVAARRRCCPENWTA